MLTVGKKYWFTPDEKNEFSDWKEVREGRLVSEGRFGVSFLSGSEILFTTVNDVFGTRGDAENELHFRKK